MKRCVDRCSAGARRAGGWSIATVAVALLPFVTAAARAVRSGWFPVGDSALLYIRAADVFTRHHPLLGSWTSASQSVGRNMNNPGAMYDWLIAPWAWVLPPGPGAALGVASVGMASVVGVAIAARAIGGVVFERCAVLVAALLSWSMGSELLIDIWQAHALLLPFLLFLVLLVGVASGHRRSMPWAVAVASLLVQTHISYAYILAVLLLAVIAVRISTRQRGSALRPTRSAWWALGVGAALWLPSVVEQFASVGEGNLSRLARSAGGGDLVLGAQNALGAVSAVLVRPWWWLRPGFSTTIPSTPVSTVGGARSIVLAGLPSAAMASVVLLALTGLLVVLAAWHRRSRRPVLSAACCLGASLPFGSVLCLSRLTVGPVGLAAHHVRWLWVAAAFVHLVLLWTVVATVPWGRRVRGARAQVLALVATAAVAMATVPVVAHPEGPTADRWSNAVLEEVFARLGALDGYGPIRYETETLRMFEPYSAAIMMELQHRGIEFRVVDEGMVRQLGEGRRATGDEVVVVSQVEGIDALRSESSACHLAVATATTDDEDRVGEASGAALEAMVRSGELRPTDSMSLLAERDREIVTSALAGDDDAIESLIYRGVLTRAVRAGAVTSSAATLGEMALSVDRWVAGAFLLLATLPPGDCPA